MASKAEPGLATGRDRRSNAGARMSRLLEVEDDDDFYKTTYGGFTEEDEDNDYQTEDSGSDVTDSDIDIDENDEAKSDGEEDGEGKRKRRLVTKAYKEPKKVSTDAAAAPVAPRPKVEKIKVTEKVPVPLVLETTIVKSSLRKSTAEKSRSTEDYVREREARSALMKQIADKKRVSDVRRLTQEELLAEAKITEKINLRSLETYQKLELEKKKSRVHRQTYAGPIVRYHSVTVPIGNEPAPETLEINVDTDTDACEPPSKQPRTTPTEKCSRTYITFSDENVLRRFFPQRRPPRPGYRSTCPVTGLPAKYFDPLTQLPYANSQAFKIIRQTYEQQLAADGETADSVEMSRPRLRHTQTV